MDNIEWKSFILSDIFDITSTSSGIDKNKIKKITIEGDNPYITRTDKNNGIDDFIIQQDYELNDGNVITIGLDTQTVFYQPHSFYTGQNIQILSNDYLNKYNALYLVNLLKIVLDKFNWGGNGATLTRLKNSRILLPTTDGRLPNYKYMEENMRLKEKELIQQYKEYLDKINYTKCGWVNSNLDSIEWKEFYINDLFEDIQRGKRLTKAKFIDGMTPYISSSSVNNGVDAFVGNDEKVRIFKNCITIANSGSVGSTFYHPYSFVASDHVTHLKNDIFNKYIYLFITSMIKGLKTKYNFNREINDTRLKNEVIMLPITAGGEINYEFMEDYMKYLDAKIISKYLDYLKNTS